MDKNKVTLFGLDGEEVDVISIPLNEHMEPGAILTHLGRKFQRGGGPGMLYSANEYGELLKESDEQDSK